jgi:hypothetical protein
MADFAEGDDSLAMSRMVSREGGRTLRHINEKLTCPSGSIERAC